MIFFKLYSCCIPVKGSTQSVLCDIQRREYIQIPNSLFHILKEDQDKSFEGLVRKYGDQETLKEYFDFLVDNELGFWTETPELFPDINTDWEHPSRITNAIIDVNERSNHNFRKIIAELEELGCYNLQIRYFKPTEGGELEAIMEMTLKSRLMAIDFVLPYSEQFESIWLEDFAHKYPRVNQLVLYSSPIEGDVNIYLEGTQNLLACVVHTDLMIDSSSHCGVIDPHYFTIDLETFMEGQQFNTCLNKKVGIDVDGEIKNCPTLKASYGNLESTSITSAITKKEFRHLWDINKDQIEVCKDCEFRYICTDCRAFIVDEKDIYSKPSKCSYDPYKGVWRDNSTLETLEQYETN